MSGWRSTPKGPEPNTRDPKLSAVDLAPERYARPMAGGAARTGRWAIIRHALSNANIAKAEASIAGGTVAHVAWNATMLVITFKRLGPIGPVLLGANGMNGLTA
jgi:hypothetical protein